MMTRPPGVFLRSHASRNPHMLTEMSVPKVMEAREKSDHKRQSTRVSQTMMIVRSMLQSPGRCLATSPVVRPHALDQVLLLELQARSWDDTYIKSI